MTLLSSIGSGPGSDELRGEVRIWLAENLPHGRNESRYDPFDYHRSAIDRREWMKALADAGLAAPTWPRELGGGGYSSAQGVVIIEELAAAHAPPHLDVIGLAIVGPMLLELASEEQKARWLPSIARGTGVWCQLFSEPSSGSDLASMTTVARRDGGDYVVRGQKVWTSNAEHARWGLLITRVEDADVTAREGFVALAVDMAKPEVSVRPLMQMHGDATFSEVFLDDVRVPAEHRIGGVDGGWRVALTTLLYERAALGGTHFNLYGPLARLLESLTEDGACHRDRGIQLLTHGLVHRLWVRRCVDLADKDGRPAAGLDWMPLKVMQARLQQAITTEIHSRLGASGMLGLNNLDTTAMLRSRGNTIEGGTTEILLSTIGERLLGLPKGG